MKDKIIDTAQILIQKYGVNGMSYSDISKKIDIRKASIHHHFPTKEDLVYAVLKRYIDSFELTLQEISDSQIQPRTKLQRVTGLFESTLKQGNGERACLCGMLSGDYHSLRSDAVSELQRFLALCQKSLVQILKEGVETEDFKINGSTKSMADVFLATLEGGLFIARVDGGSERFSKLLRQLEKSIC